MATYFISYTFTKEEFSGFGNIELDRKTEIKNYKDILDIEQTIATDKQFHSVVILNYIQLADKVPQGIIKKILNKERTW